MFSKKAGLKREDFLCENKWFETIIKPPGSLHQQQFQISDCEECTILILDSNAGVFIDQCKYCTIFIGPSQSSVFVRDCQYLKIYVITRQFRMRDCFECQVKMWCQSQAVVQSSRQIIFMQLPDEVGYFQIEKQMQEVKLEKWANNWFMIYDFTPGKWGNKENYKVLTEKNRNKKDKEKQRKEEDLRIQKLMSKTVKLQYGILPQTTGQVTQPYSIVVVSPIPRQGSGLKMIHSRVAKFPQELQKYCINQKIEKDAMVLFVKVSEKEKEKWQQIGRKGQLSIKICENSKEVKEIAQREVFVPFGDER